MVIQLAKNMPKAKSIDPGQSAHSAQADLSRYFLQMH